MFRLLSDLTGELENMRIVNEGETPDTPTDITKINTRTY
jgi:hypothetical protein